jgi:hypothetical protein
VVHDRKIAKDGAKSKCGWVTASDWMTGQMALRR